MPRKRDSWDRLMDERRLLSKKLGNNLQKLILLPDLIAFVGNSIFGLLPKVWKASPYYWGFYISFITICFSIIGYGFYRHYKFTKEMKTWERKKKLWDVLHDGQMREWFPA